jgi:hypothetical protein
MSPSNSVRSWTNGIGVHVLASIDFESYGC